MILRTIWRRKGLAAAAVWALVGPWSVVQAQSAAVITIRVTELYQRLDGSQVPVAREVQLRLGEGNRISETAVRFGYGRGGRGGRGRGNRILQNGGTFGQEFQLPRDRRHQWRVGFGNTLIRAIDHPHHTEFLTVRITDGSCESQMQYRLKPGFDTYLFLPRPRDRFAKEFRAIRSASISCHVAKGF